MPEDRRMSGTHSDLAATAARQFGVFSQGQAVAAGLDRFALARRRANGTIERIGAASYRFTGQPATWRQSLMAGVLDLGSRAVVSGRAAAALHGFDGYGEGPLEFLVPRDDRERRTVGLVRSTLTLPPIDRCIVDRCLPATSPARTIIDLAAHLRDVDLKRAVDSAIRDGGTSQLFLRRRLTDLRGPGRHGVRLLDEVLEDAGGHSFLERRFLALVRRAGLPRPATQVVFRRDGRRLARVDFAWEPARLIVEVNGHRIHSTREHLQRDEQRRTELTLVGYRVVVFTYDDVIDRPQWVVDRVRELLASAA
jgi:hypothetical protein